MSGVNKGSNETLPAANAAEEIEQTDTIETPAQATAPENEGSGGEESKESRELRESKKWKSRAIQAEKAIKEQQAKAAEEQGKFKELYETERKARQELSVKVIKEKINSSVKTFAAKAGCIDTDAVLALGDMSLLQIDEDTNEVFGADTFVEAVKKAKPYLFQAQRPPTINAASPGGVVQAKKITASDIMKMPKAEQNKYWAKAFSNAEAKAKAKG